MRLIKLRVRGFKGLRDAELDLGHDRLLVVGPNEAGKSSLLEALVAGLYGLAPAKRGSGHAGALKQVQPWTGEPAGLNLTYSLADGRELEVDWDLSAERTRVIDRTSGEDISASFETGTHGWLDVGDAVLKLPGSVFTEVACIGEGELAHITDDAEVRQSLLRVTDAGVDVLVEQAIARLQEGSRQASVPKVNAATRRNDLGRALSAVEAQLAQAQAARQALESEVESIARTEARLTAAQALAQEVRAETEHRSSASERFRVDLERARGRLSEAELRAAAVGVDGVAAEAEQPAWTDAELGQALEVLLNGPAAAPRRARTIYALPVLVIGVAALVAGIAQHYIAADLGGAALIAVGVFLATRYALPIGAALRVGERTFSSRQDLMTAIDRERALRDCRQQRAAIDLLERQLATLELHAGPGSAVGGGAGALTDITGRALARLSADAEAGVQRLTVELAGQRASLERGGRQIPEVAPLEERAVRLRRQVEHLDAFGNACRLAAATLASASEEIRRAYAPKLQAYLSRDLAQVTDGRYSEALVSDRFEVMLRVPETKSMVDLKQLSRGTQQQIYLLLRLGLMEVMGGAEILPLFLDDALALADDDRRAELLKVLEAQERQVIYFTAARGEAAIAFGARWHRVDLPRPMSGADAYDLQSLKVVDRPGA
jgi:DNA repair exonuclease SbcCD ATPase subunit